MNYTLEEIKAILSEITSIFLNWSNEILDNNNLEKLSIVGLGNSISSGWTNHSDDVNPLILKLSPFIEKLAKDESNILLGAFPIGDDNSNTNILKFLSSNPTELDTYNRMNLTLDVWHNDFGKTPLAYTTTKEKALSFYPKNNDIHLTNFYNNKTLTITNFNGFTGELLNKSKLTVNKKMELELNSMKEIINLILGLSDHSYLTVGNFPKLVNSYFLNYIIEANINRRIQNQIEKYNDNSDRKILYFDQTYLKFINFNDDNVKNIIDAISRRKSLDIVKIDNHPNVNLQYLYLCKYLLFIMHKCPLIISNNKLQNIHLSDKYSKDNRVIELKRTLYTR